MADEEEKDHISFHRESGSWLCDHAGPVDAISFATSERVGLKLTDPTKAGIHYLFVLAPNSKDAGWETKPDGTKWKMFSLSKINKTRVAKKVEVVLQQLQPEKLKAPVPGKPRPTSAPDSAYTEDPAVTVTETFSRMSIDVKVAGKLLFKQRFAYPALFRINTPSIGKPSFKFLWGRYDPESPAFNHVLRARSPKDADPFFILTELGKQDKLAVEFNRKFKLTKNDWRYDLKITDKNFRERMSMDPDILREVVFAIHQEQYPNLAKAYLRDFETAGKRVAGKDFLRKTFLHFISEQIDQTQ